MSLPEIMIPAVNIPFDIPTLLHPALAHFAIAIPVLIVVAEIFNLFINGKGIKIMSTIFMFLLIAIFFGMYLTGKVDGKAAIDAGFSATGELKEHKLLGIYLFYASIFVFVLKLISLGVNKAGFKVFYLLVLIGFLAGVLHQGKEGGELVYKYGANVKVQSDEFDDDEDEEATKKEAEAPSAKTTPVEEKAEAKDEPKEVKTETTQTKEEPKAEENKEEQPKTTQEVEPQAQENQESILDKAKDEVKNAAESAVNEAKDAVKEVMDLNKTEH